MTAHIPDTDAGRALREPALVADATGAASVSAHSGDGQARSGAICVKSFSDELTVAVGALRVLWRAVQRDGRCTDTVCADYASPNCECSKVFSSLIEGAVSEHGSLRTRGQ